MRLITTIIALLFVSLASGQQYNFRAYTIEDGLPRSGTYSLLEDQDGFLWIGIDGGGVAVFDGHKFKVFDEKDGLPSRDVRFVFQSSDGLIWMGTTEGLVRYDFKEFKTYTVNDGLADNYVRTIAEGSDGRLWVGTSNGLSIFDGKQFENLTRKSGLLHNRVRTIVKSSDDRMWIGTDDGIHVWGKRDSLEFSLFNGLTNNTILELFEDSQKRIWAGTKYGACVIVNDRVTNCYTSSNGLISDRIRAIAEDKKGHLWLGTRNGISKFDGNHFQNYDHQNGLNNDRIRDILVDQEGNVWVATYFGGINKFSQNDLVYYSTKEGLENEQVFTVHQDDQGHLILGTFEGAHKIYLKGDRIASIKSVQVEEGLSAFQVNAIHKDQLGYYWYGASDGLTITKDRQIVHRFNSLNGLIGDDIRDILEVDGNTYYVATASGLAKIKRTDSDSLQIANFSQGNHPDLLDKEIADLEMDNTGNIWIAFRNGGLGQLKNGVFRLVNVSKLIKEAVCVQAKDGRIWIGTDGNGIVSFNPDARKPGKSIIHINTTDHKIHSDHIHFLQFDHSGNIWAGSEKGISKIDLKGEKINSIKNYGKKEGLPGLETHENGAYIDQNGNLWAGTIAGLVFLDIQSSDTNPIAPRLHLTEVRVNRKERISSGSDRFKLPEALELSHDQNNLTFAFTGINFSTPSKVKYKWKLKGFDREWIGPRKRGEAIYTNLPPGDYTFLVKSSNEDGIWNESPIRIKVEIAPPFWQTIWFYMLVFVVVIGGFFLIFRWRVRALKSAKIKLEKTVHERTMELRKEKELVEAKNNEINRQKDVLAEINTRITDSINYAQRIQNAIMNPPKTADLTLKERVFVLYKPKDIVSGDFYWFAEHEDISYFTAADCTGHGVPGAFMSMIGITYLNEIIARYPTIAPDEMLNRLRDHVLAALENEGVEKSKDGMDIALCRIDWQKMELQYAGGNNSLYHVRNGSLTETKADKMPIGEHDKKDEPFTKHTIQLEKGDMIYAYSDGYADQFGGPKGKKFMYRRFKDLLVQVSKEPVGAQQKVLAQEIEQWMKESEQIDDILVIGLRI